MSPLILVGITLLTIVLGDVSHVLRGEAHPPSDPQETGNPFETKNAQDFWWMQDDSPFKNSYRYFKKCSATGKCITSKNEEKYSSSGADAFFGPIDLKKNVFFSQGVAGQGPSFVSYASSNRESGSSSAASQTFHNGVKVDLSENPFLKGSFAHAGSSSASSGSSSVATSSSFHDSVIDLSKNPFLNTAIVHDANGDKIRNENGFIGVQPSVPFRDLKKTGYHASITVSGQDGSSCAGFNHVCVPKDICVNGVVTNEKEAIDLTVKDKICKENEVCCQLPSSGLNDGSSITYGKSSVPGSQTKLTDINPQQVDILSASQEGIRPQLNFIGSSGSSTVKPIRDLSGAASETYFSSTPDYSNLHFGDDARFSNLQGLDYLPPLPVTTPAPSTYRPTPPSCPPGQYLTASGSCEFIRKECPPGTRATPSGGCEKLKITCGPGEQLGPYGTCVPIPTPPPPSCPAGQRLGPNGYCVGIPTPPPTPLSCPPGQRLGPNGYCVAISTPPPPPPSCPLGQRLVNGQCIIIDCAPGYEVNSQGSCILKPTPPPTRTTCGPGQTLGPYGQCVSPTYLPPTTCGHGQRQGPRGECIDITTQRVTYPPVTTPSPVCGPGEKLDAYGQCRAPTTTRPTCPPGSFPTAYGGCQRPTQTPLPPTTPCPPGTVKSPYGRCEIPPTPPRPVTCPSGSFLGPSGNCVRPTPSTTTRTYLPPETDRTTGYPVPSYSTGSTIDSDYRVTDKIPSPGNNVPIHVRPPGYNETTNIDLIPVGCAAALKCVQEIYCTAEGFISPVPVVLTKEQELLRAPTTDCRVPESGTIGKCCRDPEYKDPWPSANLVNGIDDGQYAEDDSIGQYKADYQRFSRSSTNRRRRVSRTKRQAEGNCGVRNLNSNPPGPGPIDADFAEISWQAMILRDSNRSLLCGGTIIRPNAVLTAAACVEGLPTSDILIKGGEWKLGIDEEPLPFQIVKVTAIARHPDFVAGSLLNNLAILVLEENLRLTKNIGTLCLPSPNLIPTQNCISTGWGKRILQLHAKGAIMHRIDMDIMDVQQCQQVLTEHFQNSLPNYNTNTLCGFSKIDQCRIDYGSALACADESGRYTLSGIFSWDTGCKQRGQIGAYVAPDVDWIDNVLNTPLKQLKRFDRAYNNARTQILA